MLCKRLFCFFIWFGFFLFYSWILFNFINFGTVCVKMFVISHRYRCVQKKVVQNKPEMNSFKRENGFKRNRDSGRMKKSILGIHTTHSPLALIQKKINIFTSLYQVIRVSYQNISIDVCSIYSNNSYRKRNVLSWLGGSLDTFKFRRLKAILW